MAWDYAELSKAAKENGGPEKYIGILVNSGRKQMVPWICVGVAGGAAMTIAIQKLVKYLSEKKARSDAEFEVAKHELIQGIKDYDAAHPEESSDT